MIVYVNKHQLATENKIFKPQPPNIRRDSITLSRFTHQYFSNNNLTMGSHWKMSIFSQHSFNLF